MEFFKKTVFVVLVMGFSGVVLVLFNIIILVIGGIIVGGGDFVIKFNYIVGKVGVENLVNVVL